MKSDVETALRGWHADGTLVPDQRLLSESGLIDLPGAGFSTIRLVLKQLIDEGRLRSEHGRGYYVCQPPRADPVISQWKRKASALVVEGPRFDVERVELVSEAGRQESAHLLRSPTIVGLAGIWAAQTTMDGLAVPARLRDRVVGTAGRIRDHRRGAGGSGFADH